MCGSALIFDKDSPIQFTLDDTKPDGSYPCIMGFIVGDNSRAFAELSKDQRKEKLATIFARVFESDEALHVSILTLRAVVITSMLSCIHDTPTVSGT